MDTSFQEQSRQETVSAAAISHPRIFISHSAKDNKFGEKLAADLRRVVGDDDAIWYDVLELHGGDTWWRKIMRELTARDAFIIILSPDSMDSYWVQQEVDIATNYRKYIVPVLYKECEIRPDLQIKQIISFLPPADYEIAFNELLTALGLSRSESLPSPPVRPAPTSSDVSSSKGFSQVEEAPTVGQENQTSAGSEVAPAEKPQSETILPEKPVSRRGIPPVRIAILAGLAILIIASGVIGFSLLSGGNQGKQTSGAATANAQLTATAQANAAPASTIEAQVHATASAIATTQSVVNATATAYAPTQTAIDATVTASGNHFPAHLGTLVFNDSLKDNTQGHGWDENADCAFTGGAYHVSGPGQYMNSCFANSTDYSNFAFQVQMTIIKGGCGGLDFRGANNVGYYVFQVCTDGTYGLASYSGTSGAWLISPTSSAAINTHLNQTNALAVIASGSRFYLYINLEYVTSMVDISYNHGQIGVVAVGDSSGQSGSEIDVAYSNAKIWTF